MELPDVGSDPFEHANGNWSRHAEDATVEVWSGWSGKTEWKGLAWMIEVSLHENRIGTRVDVTQDGYRRILVRPPDESLAREIVHEIVSGTPPP